ncbi:MAG: TIR domain-containing protein [Gammaproteobacteria bacterium]|nr:TIR domain-containing protein [Gammaproteobacteria bacterium]MDE1886553.1 TIR domain-containing protein [Gammaproteobacteria bacterium]MDE2024236.1 TIR domain-containing protein [Gammaproteobacteria bacterium]MDE2272959.1 TIR domain-containing protein [Gammaproteobacteria bacterium]
MADVFVSYARTDKTRVAPLVAAIEAKGWSVWWDPEISPGQEFDNQIDSELVAAKAVLVVWTPTSVISRWVRGEARDAAERGILVPVRFDQARLPIDVRAIHTTDLDDWKQDPASPPAQECLRALEAMIARSQASQSVKSTSASAAAPSERGPARVSICVLPFNNMSGDPEQEYFSDGITEDIITDLSKVSALSVISRNGSFLYKGKQVDIPKVARELKVTHVLEGSVRKAGGRVRISAQLIDGTVNNHVWAERYDRDASDIFAIQDEISQAIVKALKVRLLPDEKKAIERRGTDSVEAHDLYLMARQLYITNQEDEHASKAIVRTCARATEIDPKYAQAWALMAMGYRILREMDLVSDDGMAAVEKALALDPNLAEAHAVKGYILQMRGDMDGAVTEAEVALKLDPESYEANRAAGRLNYTQHRFADAVRLFEKAISLMDSDVNSVMMLISAYKAIDDAAGMRRAAELAHKRAEALLARDQNNSGIVAYSAYALMALGEGERAKARMNRALLIDPDNWNMRYNFACALCAYLKDKEAALEMMKSLTAAATRPQFEYVKADPDFELLHGDPRYQAMLAAAEARLGAAKVSPTSVGKPTESRT